MGLARARARAARAPLGNLGVLGAHHATGGRGCRRAAGWRDAGTREPRLLATWGCSERTTPQGAADADDSGGMAGRRDAVGAASGAKPAVTEDVMWASCELDVNVLILGGRGVIRIRSFNALKSTSYNVNVDTIVDLMDSGPRIYRDYHVCFLIVLK